MADTRWKKTFATMLGLSLFVFYIPLALAPIDPLEEKAYDELIKLMADVTRRFPPSEYHYVALGRSPAPVAAYMDAARPGLITHLPLSEFYARPGTATALSAAEEKRVFDHFDVALKDAPIGKKKILMVDFVIGGGSLVASLEYFEKYMAERRKLPGPVQALALAPTETPERIPADSKNITIMPLVKNYPTLNGYLGMFMLKYRSKYDQFLAPFENSAEVLGNPRPEYDELVRHFRKIVPAGCLAWLGDF